jgi:hypothetical protein
MADESIFWTQRDAAREYTRLARQCEALFTALGTMAPRLDPPASAAAASQLARRLGEHAATWAGLVPESVLLADERASAASASAIEPTLAAVVAAVAELRDDLDALLTRTTEVADGAARRAARSTCVDIDDAIDRLRLAAAPATP